MTSFFFNAKRRCLRAAGFSSVSNISTADLVRDGRRIPRIARNYFVFGATNERLFIGSERDVVLNGAYEYTTQVSSFESSLSLETSPGMSAFSS